jgi:tRNA uridine 5-carbamoylmethylation protein Kti12
MKLVIIYGPPATGKLTLAKEIAKKTDFRVFDNHHMMDYLAPLVLKDKAPFGTPLFKQFWKLYRDVRIKIIDSAFKFNDISGMIITEAYNGKKGFITNMIKTVKKNNAQVYLIKLRCDIKELEKRVYGDSRKKHGKIKHKKGLYGWFKKYEKSADLVYPYKNTLILDNTHLSVNQSANKILEFIGEGK